GLNDTGFVEGRNVAMEFRWAEGRDDRLLELAHDLVRRGVAVVITTGGESTARAVKTATSTIPIVFISGIDPVESGLVDSLNRPGGNLTGVSSILLDGHIRGAYLKGRKTIRASGGAANAV